LTAAPSSDGKEIPELGPVAEWLEVRADVVGDLDRSIAAPLPGTTSLLAEGE
jgi:hypothetical protein